MLNIIIII